MPRRIILLNGTSSSGKSSIGHALLPLLADPWLLVPMDAFTAMRSVVHTRVLDNTEIDESLRILRCGYHRSVAALAGTGNDVIMDYPVSEPWRMRDLLDVLRPYDVTLVDVRCAPAELDRRERERADRPIGLARSQIAAVHGHGDADLVVDTTDTSPADCARTIADTFEGLAYPKAFTRLRAACP